MSNLTSSSSFRGTPLSPTSPHDSTKAVQHQLRVGHPPQTPTSPPLMSVNASNNASNTQPSSSETTFHTQSLSSPPSSEPMSAQVSQKTIVTTTNTFPTPASSTNGTMASMASGDEMDQDGVHQKRTKEDGRRNSTEIQDRNAMDIDQARHNRTDHDRHKERGSTENHSWGLGSGIANSEKERAEPDDVLDLMHQKIGSPLFLCSSSHPSIGPSPTEDLIDIYRLNPLAATVARFDPVTGEKINKLRKSYEGKLKDFNLAGRNRSHKVDFGEPDSLHDMMRVPEDQWQFQSHDKDGGLNDAHGKIERAVQMDRGKVPLSIQWEELLGHEKPKASIPDTQVQTTLNAATHSLMEGSRPRRAKKRRYDEDSFEGYGEGFLDDEGGTEAGYSEEDSRPSGKKRRKKESSFSQSSLEERTGSYGVGMYAQ